MPKQKQQQSAAAKVKWSQYAFDESGNISESSSFHVIPPTSTLVQTPERPDSYQHPHFTPRFHSHNPRRVSNHQHHPYPRPASLPTPPTSTPTSPISTYSPPLPSLSALGLRSSFAETTRSSIARGRDSGDASTQEGVTSASPDSRTSSPDTYTNQYQSQLYFPPSTPQPSVAPSSTPHPQKFPAQSPQIHATLQSLTNRIQSLEADRSSLRVQVDELVARNRALSDVAEKLERENWDLKRHPSVSNHSSIGNHSISNGTILQSHAPNQTHSSSISHSPPPQPQSQSQSQHYSPYPPPPPTVSHYSNSSSIGGMAGERDGRRWRRDDEWDDGGTSGGSTGGAGVSPNINSGFGPNIVNNTSGSNSGNGGPNGRWSVRQ